MVWYLRVFLTPNVVESVKLSREISQGIRKLTRTLTDIKKKSLI